MANLDYSVKIADTNKELTAVEKIKLKDTADAISVNEAVEQGTLTLTATTYAHLIIHNEKSENKDYDVYVIIDKDGTKYATSSPSFWESFTNICDELIDAGEPLDSVQIKVFQLASKNYKGKFFITCSLA